MIASLSPAEELEAIARAAEEHVGYNVNDPFLKGGA